jgi:hypothetical protein
MKQLFATLLILISLSKTEAQQTLVGQWKNPGYFNGFYTPIITDSTFSLLTSTKVITYNTQTKVSSIKGVHIPNYGTKSMTYVKDGFYFVSNQSVGGISYDTLYYFDNKLLSVINTGIISITKVGRYLKILQVNAEQNEIYVMVSDAVGRYSVYKVNGASAQNLNIQLNNPISSYFKASNDTFVYVLNYDEQRWRKTELKCKIGSNYLSLFIENADNFVISELNFYEERFYFKVNPTQNYDSKQLYVSHFKQLDAVPSSFVVPVKENHVYVAPGVIRRINYTKRCVERIDEQSGNIIKSTNFHDDFYRYPSDKITSIKDNVWLSISDMYGTEPCLLTADDSFIRIDIYKGMFGTFDDEYSRGFEDRIVTGDTAYVIVKNQVDKGEYIYALTGKNPLPFWPVAKMISDTIHIGNVAFFKHHNNLYWYSYNSYSSDLKLYSVPISNRTVAPQITSSIGNDEWHTQLGFGGVANRNIQLSTGGINMDDSGAIVVSAHSLNYATQVAELKLLAYQENKFVKMKSGQFTAKFNNRGQLVWANSFGNTDNNLFSKLFQAINSKGDVYLVGQARGDVIFGNDTIKSNMVIPLNYLVKLDGNTGDVIWHKILFYSSDNSRNTVESMVIDEDDNIYLAIQYTRQEIQVLGYNLTNSKVSPANALLKLNESGSLVWAKNMLTPFTEKFGPTRAIVVDTKNSRIYAVQSIGDYTWHSSCKYSTWYSYVQCINTNTGEQIWTRNFESDDLHGTTSMILTKQGDIMLGGFFRGTINFQKYTFTSLPYNGCNQNQNYFALLNGLSGEVYLASTQTSDLFYPYKLTTNKQGDIFAIGLKEEYSHSSRRRLTIWQINDYTEVIAERNYNRFGGSANYSIAANDDYLAITEVVNNSPFDTFSNCFLFGEQLTVEKLNFKTALQNVQPRAHNKVVSTDYNLKISPNPFTNNIMVITEQLGEVKQLEVIDLSGRVLKTVDLNSQWYYHNINLVDLVAGLYFFKFSGTKGDQVVKIIKAE